MSVSSLVLSLVMGASPAQSIEPAISGSWYDPANSGQGVIIEVVNASAGREMVAYWFTYDAAGAPLWAVGQGVATASGATLSLVRVQGPRFVLPAPSNQPTQTSFGSAVFQVVNCNSARFTYQTPLGNGLINLTRLTQIEGQSCGSTVLNTWSPTVVAEARTEMTGPAGASGSLTLKTRPAEVSFEVEVEDVAVGTYRVFVDGIERGNLSALVDGNRVKGKLEFKAPPEPPKLPLTFDPRARLVQVKTATGSVVVSGTAPSL